MTDKHDFKAGDLVEAIRDGGHDKLGQPWQRPKRGRIYRLASVYATWYGLGCTLVGLDPKPYAGYFLLRGKELYFRKVEEADEDFVAQMRKFKPKAKQKVKEKEDV